MVFLVVPALLVLRRLASFVPVLPVDDKLLTPIMDELFCNLDAPPLFREDDATVFVVLLFNFVVAVLFFEFDGVVVVDFLFVNFFQACNHIFSHI